MRTLVLNEPSSKYFGKKYPTQVAKYIVLTKRIGVSCPNALILLKMLWYMEEESRGDSFYQSIEKNEWPNE